MAQSLMKTASAEEMRRMKTMNFKVTSPRGSNRLSSVIAFPAVRPHWLAVGGILALAAFLDLFRLDRLGYGNLYYAAAVRSMLESWHNFFFVSFDPGGFVSVDKPPLGFWIQTASARLFGFSGVA